ncbi:nucleoside 2-deoxyribosyltransferase [Trypanosoma conorhini]|uniref:Nucleoside 2-deoxyribosyltransferase n=1 Tax=Trypanosoma conorhini TaxID=83891 RepID=A0A3R7MFK6_9TRYP|nr:nucleoside 2-deoxyribosyltransferase [Trypanosoma conorhini]RNF01603.1 nucleoside 2-deoxyribosyltransferase [Trypanosoma conorhini]
MGGAAGARVPSAPQTTRAAVLFPRWAPAPRRSSGGAWRGLAGAGALPRGRHFAPASGAFCAAAAPVHVASPSLLSSSLRKPKQRSHGGSFAMRKVYVAGPAVFNADMGAAYYDRVRGLLQTHGVTPLIPVDNVATGAAEIRAQNMEMIRQCDAVIADLSPFRSHEPDCGTAFEVGYAAALGKTVLAFTSDRRSMREKYGGACDAAGRTVEDFGLPFNLMLCDGTEVFDSFEAAFQHFVRHCAK